MYIKCGKLDPAQGLNQTYICTTTLASLSAADEDHLFGPFPKSGIFVSSLGTLGEGEASTGLGHSTPS